MIGRGTLRMLARPSDCSERDETAYNSRCPHLTESGFRFSVLSDLHLQPIEAVQVKAVVRPHHISRLIVYPEDEPHAGRAPQIRFVPALHPT